MPSSASSETTIAEALSEAGPGQPTTGRPKVAILTGGGDRPYALGLASALLARGIAFDFIGSDDLDSPEIFSDPRARFLNLRGSQDPNAPLGRKIVRLLRYYCRLIGYAARSKACIFHLLWNNKFEAFDRTLLTLYYKALGKRLALTVHNVNVRKRDNNDSWFNRFTLAVQYRLLDHLFVHTERMKRELMADFKVPESKISIIPFGINSTVPNTALTPAEARQQLGLAMTDKVLLFFGNIAPYKGLEYLVDALAHLNASRHDFRLIIAGRPKGAEAYWEGIRRTIKERALSRHVILRIEYVPDADTEIYFKAADVFVLPYVHIFQSGVLFLGYNFGLPVVATDVGALRDDVVEGVTGYICPPRDAHALARCIETYFSNCSGPDAFLRAEIRGYAEDRYSWSKVALITQHVYDGR